MPTFTLTRRGPNTNATCETGFEWTEDSAQSSPCLVAAAVVGGCGSSDYTVPSLDPGNHYNPPGVNGQPINGCSCYVIFIRNSSWAAYNLYSACTACQGLNSSILTWAQFRADCDSSLSTTTYYPSDVVTLSNTSIPFYATVDPSTWQNAIFNIDQAKNISEQGHADVYGAPITSSTPSSDSTSSHSSAGAIGGGVAGGVVVLILGAIAAWWILRRRRRSGIAGIKRLTGTHQELDSTNFDTQGHTRSPSDLTSRSHYADTSFGNGTVPGNGVDAYMGSVNMQQYGLSPSPFGSSSHMGSVSSMGAFSTPPHLVGGGSGPMTSPPSSYNGRASTITGITRYDSPSPSMQFMARSQSPDSSFGHEMSIQPFLLPLTSPSSAAITKGGNTAAGVAAPGTVYTDGASTKRDSQDSLFAPPPRRMNPPAYDDAVANPPASAAPGLADSRDVAAQRRETQGTGHDASHFPVNEKSRPLQLQGSQDSSIVGPDIGAIDAYVNQMAANAPRAGGQGGSDAVPMLHTMAVTPPQGRPDAPQRRFTVKTVNTTMDDGANDSVVGDHERDRESVALA
ncbi:hypothetical protein C8R42DRAFT_472019 [Lentinula raphanica]|nr:hypothetical protein C8R42DRAFT_472019 [Lentinula raphanica]